MLLIVGGIFGSLVGGYILDKTKAYKYAEIFHLLKMCVCFFFL
jgi:hypothetical protein